MTAPGIESAMRLALEQAQRVKGTTYPNPPVGAVILGADGDVDGVGATEPVGGPHAEVMALRAAGPRAAGGTAVVTLEPCSHHGRTPPCVGALLDASGPRYAKRGLSWMEHDPEEEALADPLLLRTPIVRDGRRAVIGFDPEGWRTLAGL